MPIFARAPVLLSLAAWAHSHDSEFLSSSTLPWWFQHHYHLALLLRGRWSHVAPQLLQRAYQTVSCVTRAWPPLCWRQYRRAVAPYHCSRLSPPQLQARIAQYQRGAKSNYKITQETRLRAINFNDLDVHRFLANALPIHERFKEQIIEHRGQKD